MQLTTLDWSFIIAFFAISLAIGFYVSKKSGKNTSEYFLSGRNMPWWLLGMSMVATTFSTDTPNLVTDIVRQNGVAGNWVWWAFLLTGMLTVFVYAKLWRKSNVLTDMEFYELRYGGFGASFLRGFRSVYLGLFFNLLAMAGVCLAAIKIIDVIMGQNALLNVPSWLTLGYDNFHTVVLAGLITVVFSSMGGFRGVIYTDFLLFFLAMIGAIGAAVVAVNHADVGGLDALIANDIVADKISFLPDFSSPDIYVPILIIPLAIQWWNSWYPGAEPGGGGYIAQRMLSAKDENHAIKATFFFNILHYALRPWPWILVALASLVVFPDLQSLKAAFPNVADDKLGHDLAYPAMLTFLPNGLLGIVIASLIAAFMSTISTHLNWGASYLVHDFYKRFVRPDSSEKELVFVGRVATYLLMILALVMAFNLKNALQLFNIILMFGAGTGLIFILRWFWWRINAWAEIAAMISSGLISLGFTFWGWFPEDLPTWAQFPIVVLITSIVWIVTMLMTKPESQETLETFYEKIQPGGPGWNKIISTAENSGRNIADTNKSWTVPDGIIAMMLGCLMIYGLLFATGNWIYGNFGSATFMTLLSIGAGFALSKIWDKIGKDVI
jgi:Na+/proline symporter